MLTFIGTVNSHMYLGTYIGSRFPAEVYLINSNNTFSTFIQVGENCL